MNASEQELANYVTQMIGATQRKAMVWRRANPTTFFWDAVGGRITVQRLDQGPTLQAFRQVPMGNPRPGRYVLTANDLKTGNVKMSIDGVRSGELNQLVGQLYGSIEDTEVREGLDFLKNMLPPSS